MDWVITFICGVLVTEWE
jgi:hypothetical protein